MGRELGILGVIDVMCRIVGGMLMNSLVVVSAGLAPPRTVACAEGASLTYGCRWRRRFCRRVRRALARYAKVFCICSCCIS